MSVAQESIVERISAAAREMQNQEDPAATVKNAVQLLVQNIESCDSASISLVYGKRRVETPAASNDLAAKAGQLQAELGEGPALDTLWHEDSVYVPDLAADDRWPTWGPRLTELTGTCSILTFRLFTDKDVVGALSMYSQDADAFSDEERAQGLALAAHIAIAVLASQKIDQYETALNSRTLIAQACGLMMERFDVDAVRAFALLTRIASTENMKVRQVAIELIRTRRVPTSATCLTSEPSAAHLRTSREAGHDLVIEIGCPGQALHLVETITCAAPEKREPLSTTPTSAVSID